MVPAAAAQSCAVGSPSSPGPNSTAGAPGRAPAASRPGPRATTNWAMHTRPAVGRGPPATRTSPTLPRLHGTPSAYPRGTSARVVSLVVVYSWPYDTPSPAGTPLTSASRPRTVMAGTSPYADGSPRSGTGERP